MESFSPEMKSTGEAIGYDNKLTRRSLQGAPVVGHDRRQLRYGAAHDRRQGQAGCAAAGTALFYDLGFNIEATKGTAEFHCVSMVFAPVRAAKLSEGSTEIIDSLRQGHVSYIINTIDINQHNTGWMVTRFAARPSRTT